MASFPFIVVAGNIGSGKSTAVAALSATLGLEPYYEDVARNPHFADFYADPARWAFESQRAFIRAAIDDHEVITRRAAPAIQDRGEHEMLHVFASHHHALGNISHDQLGSLTRLVAEAEAVLARPSLVLYVHAPVEELARRVRARGRPEEEAVDVHYLRELAGRYEPLLHASCSPVLRVDTSIVDPRADGGRRRLTQLVERAVRSEAR